MLSQQFMAGWGHRQLIMRRGPVRLGAPSDALDGTFVNARGGAVGCEPEYSRFRTAPRLKALGVRLRSSRGACVHYRLAWEPVASDTNL